MLRGLRELVGFDSLGNAGVTIAMASWLFMIPAMIAPASPIPPSPKVQDGSSGDVGLGPVGYFGGSELSPTQFTVSVFDMAYTEGFGFSLARDIESNELFIWMTDSGIPEEGNNIIARAAAIERMQRTVTRLPMPEEGPVENLRNDLSIIRVQTHTGDWIVVGALVFYLRDRAGVMDDATVLNTTLRVRG